MLEFRENLDIADLNENQIVLDIETTGVSRQASSVIVVGLIESSGEFIQFAINDVNDEENLLRTIFEYIDDKEIITFNGANFDLPFLKSRYEFFNLNPFVEKSQFDIYRYFIQNRLLTDIELFSLQEIEKYADIGRFENFEFQKDRELYQDLHKIDLSKILLHNKYDVVNTYKIMKLVDSIESTKYFPIILNENEIKLKIESIRLDKNIMSINLTGPVLSINHYYENKNYLLEWSEENIHISLRVMEGLVASETRAFVHIANEKIEGLNNKEYKVPDNIVILYDGRYILDNIKLLCEKVIKDFKVF